MTIINQINNILHEAILEINNAKDVNELLTKIKPNILSKSSPINAIAKQMIALSIDEKKIIGQKINEVLGQINQNIVNKIKNFELQDIENEIKHSIVDITLSSRKQNKNGLHILTKTTHELLQILNKYGFVTKEGPEIESDFFNFEALNIPKNHPARQMQDTFYLNKNQNTEDLLLRTQTTGVDVREILSNNLTPPLAFCSYGKVFRVDSDSTHSPMFHQLEGLMIDENINMANLKYYIYTLLSEFFQTDIEIRFRPSFFPFTEPSAEIDISYSIVNDKICIGKGDKFLEIGGCGMLHKNVLQNCQIDHNKFQAIAFGLGIDRLAMLKYGIVDIRNMTSNSLQWLQHYSVNASNL